MKKNDDLKCINYNKKNLKKWENPTYPANVIRPGCLRIVEGAAVLGAKVVNEIIYYFHCNHPNYHMFHN